MLDYRKIWQLGLKDKKRMKRNDFRINSFRVYSVPLQRDDKLRVTAKKKELSQVTSSKNPRNEIWMSLNRTSVLYNRNLEGSLRTLETGIRCKNLRMIPDRPLSKIRWFEKHFSCYQKSHLRSKSIQGSYDKKKGKDRKASLISTCEISLQT